jgi:CheY-like chemotaxis protein
MAHAAVAARALRVLVVDDDPAIQRALARSLHGHHVVAASGGAEALALLERDFDLVLCDLMMPGVTGMDVAERLATSGHPALEVLVLMTGGAVTERAQRFLATTRLSVLHKPVEPAALAELTAAAARRQFRAAS